ncbi:high mobility group B protein 1-like protein, partial [Tanacetum coccineum]
MERMVSLAYQVRRQSNFPKTRFITILRGACCCRAMTWCHPTTSAMAPLPTPELGSSVFGWYIPAHAVGFLFSCMKGAKGKAAKRDTLKAVDDKKVGKRKAPAKAAGKSKAAKKAAKDPNKPKRPPSAFFVFLEEFRKTFKKENPTVKAVSAVGKAGGEKWKSLSAAVSLDLILVRPKDTSF